MTQEGSSDNVSTPDRSSRGIPADARVRFELLEDAREAVVGQLCNVISEALAKMSEDLSTLALKSVQRDEQQALMEAAQVVRQNRADIEAGFRKAFIDNFERRLFRKGGEEQSDQFNGELMLIDDSVLSDRLVVDRLVHKARGRLDPEEVLGIRARLAALLERDWFEETQHPAAPEAVFAALKDALNAIAPRNNVQSLLLDAFEPHVSSNLNGVYSAVNGRLKARSILPKIRQQVALVGGGARRPARAAPGESQGPGSNSAESVAGNAGVGGSRATGQGAAAGTGGAGSATSSGLDPQHAELVSAMNRSLQQLMMGMPTARGQITELLTDPETFGNKPLPLPLAQPGLIEAIAHLQSALLDTSMVEPELLTHLSERVRDSGSPLDQLTVEIVSMVFDYIYADRRLTDPVRHQLMRLQVVAVKAALLDRSFFARRQHPLRKLIDRISDIASDPDIDFTAEGKFLPGLESAIAWIIASFDSDLKVFEDALTRLEELASEEADRRQDQLVDLTLQAEKVEQRAQAQDLARVQLRERVDESTPEFIREFLDQWWSEAIAAAATSSDPQGLKQAECYQIAEALVWSVVPKLPSEVPKLASLLPKLIRGLTRGLAPVQIPKDAQSAFLNHLLKVHTQSIDSAKNVRPVETVAARGVSRVRMRSDGSILYTPPRASEVKAAPAVPAAGPVNARLQRGALIDIEESQQTKQYKLAWVSPSQKLYILSRHPDEARTFEAAEFADLLADGRARIVERTSRVDAAIGQMKESESRP